MIPKQVDDSLFGLRPGGTERERLEAVQWLQDEYELRLGVSPPGPTGRAERGAVE